MVVSSDEVVRADLAFRRDLLPNGLDLSGSCCVETASHTLDELGDGDGAVVILVEVFEDAFELAWL